MQILAIDPGTEKSGVLQYCTTHDPVILAKGIADNDMVVFDLERTNKICTHLVIEDFECFGMPIGKTSIVTIRWTGQFIHAWNGAYTLLPRRRVKMELCKTARAKDANVRQSLIDIFGGKEKAIGRKATPGPLYGIKSHLWSALALAVTYERQLKRGEI